MGGQTPSVEFRELEDQEDHMLALGRHIPCRHLIPGALVSMTMYNADFLKLPVPFTETLWSYLLDKLRTSASVQIRENIVLNIVPKVRMIMEV